MKADALRGIEELDLKKRPFVFTACAAVAIATETARASRKAVGPVRRQRQTQSATAAVLRHANREIIFILGCPGPCFFQASD